MPLVTLPSLNYNQTEFAHVFMTIVFLSPRFPPQIGGVEKHAFEVAKRLSKKHKVIVVTESPRRDMREKIGDLTVFRLYFGKVGWFKKIRIWIKIFKLRRLFEKADIVHCHDVFFWYIPLRLFYPGKKVYITFHGYETIFPPSGKTIFIRELSERLSKGNISIGSYIKKWYGTNPSLVSYGAADGNKYSKVKKPNSKLRILFVGRMDEDTGVRIYSQTLAKLKNFEFEACGDGALRKELEKFGKVHGFVKNVRQKILKSDIVFAASYLSILEAMINKRPVFSVFENPLKEDYLKMTPFKNWITIQKSSKVLANRMKSFVKSKKIREKKVNLAYNWAKKETWDKLTADYLRLWSIEK